MQSLCRPPTCPPIDSFGSSSRSPSWIECEDALPVVLHADDGPAFLLRFVIERLREDADLGVRQPLGRTVGVLALRVVVEYQHQEPCAVARSRVLQHLTVAGRVAERRIGP